MGKRARRLAIVSLAGLCLLYQDCTGSGFSISSPASKPSAASAAGSPSASQSSSGNGAPSSGNGSGAGTPSSPASPAPQPQPSPTPPSVPPIGTAAVRYVGRWDFSDSKGARASWSGTSVQANFSGTQVSVSFDASSMADNPYFVAVIDGGKPKRFGGTMGVFKSTLATALSAGNHSVSIFRETEGAQGPWQFLGFDFGGGTLLPASVPAKLQMEIIGDSLTCGYGNNAVIAYPPTCSGNASLNESNYRAYGSILARMFGADLSTVCFSGIGIYRNYAGQTDSPSSPVLGQLYQDTLTYSNAVAAHQYPYTAPAGSSADIVIVNLGSNDVGSALSPPPKSNFEANYVQLLKQVRINNPKATIFLTLGPSLPQNELSPMLGYINDIIATMNDPKISSLPLSIMDVTQGVGCDYHPSPAEDISMANQLAPLISQKLGITAATTDPNPL